MFQRASLVLIFPALFLILYCESAVSQDCSLPWEEMMSALPAPQDPDPPVVVENEPPVENREFLVRDENERPNPSFRLFARDLGGNFKSLASEENFAPLVNGLALTGIARGLDDSIHSYFSSRNTNVAFTEAGAEIGRPYVFGSAVGAVFLLGLTSENQKFRSFGYALTQGYIVNQSLTTGLKYAFGRTRPDGSNNLSFPSGHSSDMFMAATVVHHYYGRTAGFIAYGVAGLVAGSRVKRNVHWFSDVAAGATIGYIVGRTVSRNTGGWEPDRTFSITPAINPARKEYGVDLSIRLP